MPPPETTSPYFSVIIYDYFIEIDLHAMDPLVSIAVQNAIKCTNQREAYDRLLQPLNPKDPDGYIRKCYDILKVGNQSLFHSSAFVAV
jgi:hypothetical protein